MSFYYKMTTQFIFFGCWNEIEYIVEDYIPPRNIVLNEIKNVETNIKTMIIAGDNWYPNVKNGTKYYLDSVLHSGYDLLQNCNMKTYIAIGNHDVDSNEKSPNCMINKQIKYIQRLNNPNNLKPYKSTSPPTIKLSLSLEKRQTSLNNISPNLYNFYLPTIEHKKRQNLPRRDIINNINFIFIDLENNAENIYREIYIKEIINLINTTANDPINRPIIIVGHNPLLTCKLKNNKQKVEKIYMDSHELYLLLLTSIANSNAVYICADTHNFQIGNYTFKDNKNQIKSFRTVICGTGGAHLDDLCNQNDYLCKKIIFSEKLDTTTSSKMITFDGYGIKSYGY